MNSNLERRVCMNVKKWWLSFALVTALLLGACGTSLEKPTGLEKDDELVIPRLSEEDEEANEEIVEDVVVEEESPIEEEVAQEDKSVVYEKPTPSVNKEKDVQEKPTPAKPETPAANQTEKQPKKVPTGNTLIYSIVISEASNEIPLPPTEMEITDGETVLNVLIRITKERKIQMDYRGGRGATAYIEGIDNVYEFDRGQGSGWMYSVNGIFPDRGAGVVPLMAGDIVEWQYTTNLGQDLSADLKPFRR